MEGHCSTGQSPQWAVVPMEEEEGYAISNLTDDGNGLATDKDLDRGDRCLPEVIIPSTTWVDGWSHKVGMIQNKGRWLITQSWDDPEQGSGPQRCDAALLGTRFQTFRKNVSESFKVQGSFWTSRTAYPVTHHCENLEIGKTQPAVCKP